MCGDCMQSANSNPLPRPWRHRAERPDLVAKGVREDGVIKACYGSPHLPPFQLLSHHTTNHHTTLPPVITHSIKLIWTHGRRRSQTLQTPSTAQTLMHGEKQFTNTRLS